MSPNRTAKIITVVLIRAGHCFLPVCNLRAVTGMQDPAGSEGVRGISGALIFPRVYS